MNKMIDSVKVLIVDDHPMVARGYQLSLQNIQDDYNIVFDVAHNCDDVISKMEDLQHCFYSLVLLDIALPPSKNNVIVNGEDLGFQIRIKFPGTKIIVHTGLNDSHCISNIFNTIRPEGFLIKSDINEDVLIASICSVLGDRTYYSENVRSLLSPDDFDDIYLDNWNRKILFHLSLGFKMKELPDYIPLSLPTIERRKKQLKSLLGVPHGGNRELLEVAKNKGFI